MEELIDDEKFIVQFPVWMLLHPQALSNGLIKTNSPTGECGFPLFTDQDLAERFKASVPPLAHYVLGAAKDRPALLSLLDMLKAKGVDHVSIDPTNTRTRFVPLGDVYAAIREGRNPDQAATV